MTIVYGGLLGVFALGMANRHRGSDASAVAGLCVGGLVGAALFVHPLVAGRTLIAWPWWIPLAALASLLVAAIPRRPAQGPDARIGRDPEVSRPSSSRRGTA